MAEDHPTGSYTSGSQYPLLRQKMLNRAATLSEGVAVMHSANRRRSSIQSDHSDLSSARLPTAPDAAGILSSDGASLWEYAPLAFAILPAFASLLFTNGGSYVTDVLLLAIAAIFLKWCLKAPWEWYHAVQQQQQNVAAYAEPAPDALIEDEQEAETTQVDSPDRVTHPEESISSVDTDARDSASRRLAREEKAALFLCFVGPILGAYLLHAIRSQLTSPAEGLVSNYNLTIFAMVAEIRPVSHIIKRNQQRLARLQHVARPQTNETVQRQDIEDIYRRLADVERRLPPTSAAGSDAEATKLRATVHKSLQSQLDALNRAVRRYEKRQVAQSIQLEARFGDLEMRLKDALALAAAAARPEQRPGVVSSAATRIIQLAMCISHMIWRLVTYPWRLGCTVVSEIRRTLIEFTRRRNTDHRSRRERDVSFGTPQLRSKAS
ncbi:hypothetical protein M011DRAFT_36425 [Sporormia fimetaria CBS 119925]|uniref:Uncharacterized protein n=1 Tax=Sporormia fimetaria CBS 119925 TaxID=1340428 RepID=A0A6A6VEU2_9PLEO|nr:hypothetical protein M011DRAFT_36425 [Sporormia fimetaria CBS 119925]